MSLAAEMLARGCKARTRWEDIAGGGGRRLVREWVNEDGHVEGFEVVATVLAQRSPERP